MSLRAQRGNPPIPSRQLIPDYWPLLSARFTLHEEATTVNAGRRDNNH